MTEALRGLLAPLPRRPPLTRQPAVEPPPLSAGVTLPPTSALALIRRALAWGVAMTLALIGAVRLRVRGPIGPREQGVLLRGLFERLGGTATKLGQQLSIRVDLLPPEACEELARLTDSAPAFPVAYAKERIEATAGQPIDALFSEFRETPIGAASIACVYRATLRTGGEVAVKVQRPGVADSFAQDLRCLELACGFLEWTTLVRPGTFKHLHPQLRFMFGEELDLVTEARYQRLFRQLVRRDGLNWVSAPRVVHALCGPDVMTSEFVAGVPMAKVIEAVETEDAKALAELAAQDIDPALLGSRLWWLGHWGKFEAPFYHADPHPGNLIVRPHSELVLIDFGACGSMSWVSRLSQLTLLRYTPVDDYQEMAKAVLLNLLPIPQLHVERLLRELEPPFHRFVLALNDEESEWWESSTAPLWLAFMEVIRGFEIPIHQDLLRVIRSTLLYDTLVTRLNPGLSVDEVRSYLRDRSKRIARRARERGAEERLPDPEDSALSRAVEAAEALGATAGRTVSQLAVVAKAAEITRRVVGLGLGILAAEGALLTWLWWRSPGEVDPDLLALTLLTHPLTLLTLLVASGPLRRLRMRLEDPE